MVVAVVFAVGELAVALADNPIVLVPTDRMVVPGVMPKPEIGWPTMKPAVVLTFVRVGLPEVEIAVQVPPLVKPVLWGVAKVVLTTDAPAGIPGPVIV